MLRAEHLLADGERSLIMSVRFLELSLGPQQRSEVVQIVSNGGMLRTKGRLVDRQGTLLIELCLIILLLVLFGATQRESCQRVS